MKVFRIRESSKLPVRNYNDMCYDLFADIEKSLSVSHGEILKIPLGVKIEFPPCFHASLRPRSGLATKGIDILGGQIDNGYRGELIAIITNHSKNPYTVIPGEKICQMKLEQDVTDEIEEVFDEKYLTNTYRKSNGFGSSGRF